MEMRTLHTADNSFHKVTALGTFKDGESHGFPVTRTPQENRILVALAEVERELLKENQLCFFFFSFNFPS